jgi:hypothetical protein
MWIPYIMAKNLDITVELSLFALAVPSVNQSVLETALNFLASRQTL